MNNTTEIERNNIYTEVTHADPEAKILSNMEARAEQRVNLLSAISEMIANMDVNKKALAEMMGMARPATISDIFNLQCNPTLDTLSTWQDNLGINFFNINPRPLSQVMVVIPNDRLNWIARTVLSYASIQSEQQRADNLSRTIKALLSMDPIQVPIKRPTFPPAIASGGAAAQGTVEQSRAMMDQKELAWDAVKDQSNEQQNYRKAA